MIRIACFVLTLAVAGGAAREPDSDTHKKGQGRAEYPSDSRIVAQGGESPGDTPPAKAQVTAYRENFPDGKPKVTGWIDAETKQRVLRWTTYYSNGQKQSEGVYKKGLQDGVWTFWDLKGEAIRITYQAGAAITAKFQSNVSKKS